jgi:hypothetical protein
VDPPIEARRPLGGSEGSTNQPESGTMSCVLMQWVSYLTFLDEVSCDVRRHR